jgi:glycosyltransferase involved in cell wall biosynthesis
LRGYYLLADLVIIPSICPDALPRVGLEALALGKPLIGSNCGGISDLIENGINGYLFTPGSVDEFTSKLRSIFSDSRRLISMGKNSLNKARTIFSADVVADKVISCYEKLMYKNEGI